MSCSIASSAPPMVWPGSRPSSKRGGRARATRRARLVELMRAPIVAPVGDCGVDDTLATIRDEMRKFADSEVAPKAHQWHLTNSYIPLDVLTQMSDLGVFGLTISEEYG